LFIHLFVLKSKKGKEKKTQSFSAVASLLSLIGSSALSKIFHSEEKASPFATQKLDNTLFKSYQKSSLQTEYFGRFTAKYGTILQKWEREQKASQNSRFTDKSECI
jgi:hypothetical protein